MLNLAGKSKKESTKLKKIIYFNISTMSCVVSRFIEMSRFPEGLNIRFIISKRGSFVKVSGLNLMLITFKLSGVDV
jgi:hypothetical protein